METSDKKQAIVDKVKKSTNILVTVARDPSVDALAAALGFTLMLNKMEKHATAVFSGTIPPAITFLEPEKTFEGTVDSLRDFIIALDKEKADRLRYKVEGDVVRIYITPYRTTLTEKDMHYSQGDFNVDLVVALGVENQSDLDQAIVTHGRILHDASVATINASNLESTVGSLDWKDEKASGLCEMLFSLAKDLQPDALDEQISTALLTGVVSVTERFSNDRTTPEVMSMSAELMAAGANQQLIAEKLQPPAPEPTDDADQGQQDIPMPPQEEPEQPVDESQPQDQIPQDGSQGFMQVEHDGSNADKTVFDKEEYERQIANEQKIETALGHSIPAPILSANASPDEPDEPGEDASQPTDSDSAEDTDQSSTSHDNQGKDWRDTNHHSTPMPPEGDEPMLGGTLNATTQAAEEAKRAEARARQNRTLLSHEDNDDEANNQPIETKYDGEMESEGSVNGRVIQPVTMAPIHATPGMAYEETPMSESSAPEIQPAAASNPTIADLEAQVNAIADNAPSPINDQSPMPQPMSEQLDPDPYQQPDTPSIIASSIPPSPASAGMPTPMDIPSPTTLPPMPDFSTLPPMPSSPSGEQQPFDQSQQAPPQPGFQQPPQSTPGQTQPPAVPPAPGQFQIPGQ